MWLTRPNAPTASKLNLLKILEAAEAADREYDLGSAALAAHIINEYEERARTKRDLGPGPDADEPEDEW
jgi:hypothetical protein